MKLRLERRWKKATYTIGNLYVDGKYFCNTLEDKDRGLNRYDAVERIKAKKVYGETAIPTGAYDVLMDVVSPKYKAVEWYRKGQEIQPSPKFTDSASSIAHICEIRGDKEGAIEAYREVLRLMLDHVKAPEKG